MTTGVRYLETRDVPLHDLVMYPGNAKRGDVDQIRASLKRNGQYRSLVVRLMPDGSMVILAGNHTYQALRLERYDTGRCEIIECGDDTARRINLADNRLAELGGYDDDALVQLLSYLDDDYTGTGYTQADVDRLLDPPSFDGGEDEEESPSGIGEPVVAYNLVFDDETQQARWYSFVRWLKREYPDCETLGERLMRHLDTVPVGGADR
ncbi:ParB/RepB/Spo0J family partition protein [Saccharothrix hoggarensis]|uniref:ParB/RepB/Spo0J family partition protein n=1 Tax=Saccharothrix hoggarensis TaxID=913853 RepID=A0ABW3QGS8_9PSEU